MGLTMTRSVRYGAFAALGNLALAISPLSAQTVTVVALGDSLTAGYGLPAADGFVAQMQAWLDAAGADVVLQNAGVSGDTTAGGLSRVDWALGPEVDAMIVALGGNDYLRAIDPDNSRANLAGILDAADARGIGVLLVGIAAGGNYGPDYASAFNGMYVDLATQYDTALRSDFFAGLGDVRDAGNLADFMQADGIHPNAAGVAEIVADLGPDVAALADRSR